MACGRGFDSPRFHHFLKIPTFVRLGFFCLCRQCSGGFWPWPLELAPSDVARFPAHLSPFFSFCSRLRQSPKPNARSISIFRKPGAPPRCCTQGQPNAGADSAKKLDAGCPLLWKPGGSAVSRSKHEVRRLPCSASTSRMPRRFHLKPTAVPPQSWPAPRPSSAASR